MNGAFIIDKPAGLTSHDVVGRVRKIIGDRRAGHTGTLDPFATGVLVVLVGRATRLAQFLAGAEKEYEGVIRLGFATSTGDVTGERIQNDFTTEARRTTELQREEIDEALQSFRGEIEQTPPMYSAKKIGGKKLYELARRGDQIEREPVQVLVNEFEAIPKGGCLLKKNDDNTVDLRVRVVCSAGTYVRTLAEDFGKQLGFGAHLAELRRTRAGRFTIEEAMTLEQLAELAESNLADAKVISPDAVLSHLAAIELTVNEATRTIHGIDVAVDRHDDWEDGAAVRLRNAEGQLIAVGTFDESRGAVHPKVVIAHK